MALPSLCPPPNIPMPSIFSHFPAFTLYSGREQRPPLERLAVQMPVPCVHRDSAAVGMNEEDACFCPLDKLHFSDESDLASSPFAMLQLLRWF